MNLGVVLFVLGAFLLYLVLTGKTGKFLTSWQATA